VEVEAALEDLEEGPGLFILALGVGEQRQRSVLILALRSDEPVAGAEARLQPADAVAHARTLLLFVQFNRSIDTVHNSFYF